jgi:hypothetical protein
MRHLIVDFEQLDANKRWYNLRVRNNMIDIAVNTDKIEAIHIDVSPKSGDSDEPGEEY